MHYRLGTTIGDSAGRIASEMEYSAAKVVELEDVVAAQTDDVLRRVPPQNIEAEQSVLGAVLLASPVSSLISGGGSAAVQSASSAGRSSGPMDGYVDTLLRSDAPASQQGSSNGSRGELNRLFVSSFQNGSDLKPADREYVSKVVAARTGLGQADADKRVNEVVTQAKSDIDAARKATAQLAFWLTASLLMGAFCSSLAATEGGGLRDGTWKYRNRR